MKRLALTEILERRRALARVRRLLRNEQASAADEAAEYARTVRIEHAAPRSWRVSAPLTMVRVERAHGGERIELQPGTSLGYESLGRARYHEHEGSTAVTRRFLVLDGLHGALASRTTNGGTAKRRRSRSGQRHSRRRALSL
jgi:hypothetical protein